jgi:hypothetical protein
MVIKSRRMRWAEHVEHGSDDKCLEYLKGRDHLEDLGIDGKILLELILGK